MWDLTPTRTYREPHLTPTRGNTFQIGRIKSIEGEQRCRGHNSLRLSHSSSLSIVLYGQNGRNELWPLHSLVPLLHAYFTCSLYLNGIDHKGQSISHKPG